MNYTVIISIVFTLGITLLVIVIKYFPFITSSFNNSPPMYFRLNFVEKKITVITFRALKEDINKLFDDDYELIRLPALKAFINHKTKLPQTALFIAVNDACIYNLLKALPCLKKDRVSIIIFIPVFLFANHNKFQEIQPRLRQFIFKEGFKINCEDTQLNCETSPTI